MELSDNKILLKTQGISAQIGGKTLCRNLHLTVFAGEVWGMLGPNGCGKTTLLHTFAGLLPLAQGEIFLCEKNIRHLSNKAIAKRQAILFQDSNETFPMTVWEYCKASRYPHLPYFKGESKLDEQIVSQALASLDLHHYANKMVHALSGGEKRRLAIAAILAQTPLMYLLDEPTNHLDIRHQMHILKIFQQLVQKKSSAVMMSLHDINLAQQFCNRILLFFSDGSIQQGRPADTLTAENLTRLYQHPIKEISDGKVSFWRAE